jgi:hypothetical protein
MAWRGDIAATRTTPRHPPHVPGDIEPAREIPAPAPAVPVLEPCRLALVTRAGNRATGKRHHIGLQTTFPVALDYATAAGV